MSDWTIDLDLPKGIFHCRGVKEVQWRVSCSGKGFHLRWTCSKTPCKLCDSIEWKYDDTLRHLRDKTYRKPYQRRVLWDRKGTRKAGPWHTIKRKEAQP